MSTLAPVTVLDIGANNGQFSLMARLIWPQSQIIACEPLQGPARKFRKVFAGDSLVEFHQVAIGQAEEACEMHVSRRQDSSSLLPISQRQVAFSPGTDETGRQSVRVTPLGTLLSETPIRRPCLMKIDVQGYELAVLEGSKGILEKIDYIYCELSFRELYTGQHLSDDVISWLHGRGFRVLAVNQVSFDSQKLPVQADFLFGQEAHEHER
jgi:FkbM family methyltransferase